MKKLLHTLSISILCSATSANFAMNSGKRTWDEYNSSNTVLQDENNPLFMHHTNIDDEHDQLGIQHEMKNLMAEIDSTHTASHNTPATPGVQGIIDELIECTQTHTPVTNSHYLQQPSTPGVQGIYNELENLGTQSPNNNTLLTYQPVFATHYNPYAHHAYTPYQPPTPVAPSTTTSKRQRTSLGHPQYSKEDITTIRTLTSVHRASSVEHSASDLNTKQKQHLIKALGENWQQASKDAIERAYQQEDRNIRHALIEAKLVVPNMLNIIAEQPVRRSKRSIKPRYLETYARQIMNNIPDDGIDSIITHLEQHPLQPADLHQNIMDILHPEQSAQGHIARLIVSKPDQHGIVESDETIFTEAYQRALFIAISKGHWRKNMVHILANRFEASTFRNIIRSVSHLDTAKKTAINEYIKNNPLDKDYLKIVSQYLK